MVASKVPSVIAVAVELMRAGLDRDSTAVAEVALLIVLDARVNEAPATCDTALLIVNRLGLYSSVNVPEVTLRPLDSAIGMPLPGMLLATLIVAGPIETPGVVEDNR